MRLSVDVMNVSERVSMNVSDIDSVSMSESENACEREWVWAL